jgi:hypothetical protein
MVTSRMGNYMDLMIWNRLKAPSNTEKKIFHAIKEDVLAFDILFVEVRI